MNASSAPDAVALLTKRKEFELYVIGQAWEDPDFRAELLADPAAALTAIGVPEELRHNIEVVPEAAGKVVIILPNPPLTDQLSEAELDKISGGNASDAVNYLEFQWKGFLKTSDEMRKWFDDNITNRALALAKNIKIFGGGDKGKD